MSAFLLMRLLYDAPPDEYWLTVYLVPSLIAVVAVSVLILRKRMLNRLLFGVDVYLWVGAGSLLVGLGTVNDLLGRVEEVGMLLVILITGVGWVLAGKSFVGGGSAPPSDANPMPSWCLLFVVALLVAGAWLCRGQPWYHEAIPFFALFGLNGWLAKRPTFGANFRQRARQ